MFLEEAADLLNPIEVENVRAGSIILSIRGPKPKIREVMKVVRENGFRLKNFPVLYISEKGNENFEESFNDGSDYMAPPSPDDYPYGAGNEMSEEDSDDVNINSHDVLTYDFRTSRSKKKKIFNDQELCTFLGLMIQCPLLLKIVVSMPETKYRC